MADFARRHAKSKDEKMSLLETFFLKFQSDGLKEISAETEGTTQKADKMGNSFVEAGNRIIKTLAPIVGLAALINRTMNFASSAEEMSFLAQNTGMAVEKFQALAIAAENYGGTAEGIAGSLQGLNTNLNNMRFGRGGGGVEDAAITYGINLYGANGLATADELLMNVAKRFESLNSMQQIDLGQRLGLDEGTIRLLQTGVANVQAELERGRKYSLFSAEDVENSRKFERTMRDIKLGLAQIFGVVARSLLPSFISLGDNIREVIDFTLDNATAIKGFFLALSSIFAALAVKSAIAFAPLYLLLGLAGSFGLILADLEAMLRGGKSVVGDFKDSLSNLWDDKKGKGFFESFDIVKLMKNLIPESIPGENSPKLDMTEVKQKLAMTQVPLASVPQGSVSTSYANTDQSVYVGQITVNTQATDAQGIAEELPCTIQTTMQGMATPRI